MNKALLIVTIIFSFIVVLTGCSNEDKNKSSSIEEKPDVLSLHEQYVGTVMLIVEDVEYEPGINYIHTNQYTDAGELMAGTGTPFEFWLESNLDLLTEIANSDNMKIMVSGENGKIITHLNRSQDSLTYGEYQLIAVPETDFHDGIAYIHLLEEGVYIVYVEVHWSGDKDDFIRNRYVFKIVN